LAFLCASLGLLFFRCTANKDGKMVRCSFLNGLRTRMAVVDPAVEFSFSIHRSNDYCLVVMFSNFVACEEVLCPNSASKRMIHNDQHIASTAFQYLPS
jgi:hypothetical protein